MSCYLTSGIMHTRTYMAYDHEYEMQPANEAIRTCVSLLIKNGKGTAQKKLIDAIIWTLCSHTDPSNFQSLVKKNDAFEIHTIRTLTFLHLSKH